jgi:hypothetical protein
VVAIVASPPLAASGWGLSVATDLARGWSAARPVVVVVDTDLERPRLHRTLGLDNAVGLAEVLRGDSAVAEATSPVKGDRLFCLPAGNVVHEPAHFPFDVERWSRLCRAFAQAGVTVVAYAPQGIPWLEGVLAAATDVVELHERHRPLHRPPSRAPVRAVLGPGAPETAQAFDTTEDSGDAADAVDAPEESGGGTGDVRTLESPGVGAPGRAHVPEAGGPSDATRAHPGGLLASGTRPLRKRGSRDRGQSRPWLTAESIMVASVFVIAGIVGIRISLDNPIGRPDERALPLDAAEFETVPNEAFPAAAEPPEPGPGEVVGPRSAAAPVTPPLRFSIAVASYTSASIAEGRLRTLSAATPGVPWVIAPVLVRGVTYYRVLAGMVEDTAAAEALAARLAPLIPGDPEDWLVRATGSAFDFGEWESPDLARAALSRVRGAGIPAHVARIDYDDGSARWRIYAGGFADAAEAAHLESLIDRAGLEAVLTARLGPPIDLD